MLYIFLFCKYFYILNVIERGRIFMAHLKWRYCERICPSYLLKWVNQIWFCWFIQIVDLFWVFDSGETAVFNRLIRQMKEFQQGFAFSICMWNPVIDTFLDFRIWQLYSRRAFRSVFRKVNSPLQKSDSMNSFALSHIIFEKKS